MSIVDRDGLAAFLRAHRAATSPADAGLPDAGRRRTQGLRRQEVAQIAGLSVDYYIRLEQGRGPNPSPQVLSAIARALMLSGDERDYLFRIAGQAPPEPAKPSREITAGIRNLLDSMTEIPAYILDAAGNVLAWNRLATCFISDLSGHQDRNMIRWTFGRTSEEHIRADSDAERFTRVTVADLRAAYARFPGDPAIQSLVTEMLALSPLFAQMWDSHEVQVRGPMMKRLVHPDAGPLEFECQVLHIADTGQRLITYCAAPGSATQKAFRMLAEQVSAGSGDPEPARALPGTGSGPAPRLGRGAGPSGSM